MTNIRCHGVLFDLDGVLVDSTPAVARVWARWAREHGFDPDEVVRKAHGRPSITTIRELLPHADHATEDREMERREIADVDGVIPLPGAMELLRALLPQRWAIVTSCTRALAHVRIAAAGLPLPKYLVTAGARVLALRTTASDAELQLAGADWIADNCAELFLDSSVASENCLLIGLRTKQPWAR